MPQTPAGRSCAPCEARGPQLSFRHLVTTTPAMANASAKRVGTPSPRILPCPPADPPHSSAERRGDQEPPPRPPRVLRALAPPPPPLQPRRAAPHRALLLGVRALARPLRLPLALPRAHRLAAARPHDRRAPRRRRGPLPPRHHRVGLRRRLHHLGLPARLRRVRRLGLVALPHRESLSAPRACSPSLPARVLQRA